MTLSEKIQVIVNGEEKECMEGMSIQDLLSSLDIGKQRVAVAMNGAVVPRAQHVSTYLEEGFRVEIVRMVGGG